MKQSRASSSRFFRASVLGTATGLLIAACSSGTETRDEDLPSDGLPETGAVQLELTRAADCDDLLTQVQNTVLGQLEQRAEQLRTPSNGSNRPGGITTGPIGQDPGGVPGNASDPVDNGGETPTADPGPAPRPPSAGPTGGSDGDLAEGDAVNPNSPSAPDEESGGFSGTTVQVKDVDEADIVKTEGDRIYLLHGGTLFVLNGWPAASTEILGSALVEGRPSEMFIRDGKAVVFSNVYGDVGAEIGVQSSYADYYYGASYTKLTVLDVSGNTPSVLRESYVEGDYISSRRHDGIVRAIVQDGFKVPPLGNPTIEYTDLFGQPFPQDDIDAQVDAWLERTIKSVRATELGDWLPREFARVNGQLDDVEPRCGDYYAPDPRLVESGVTSVIALDLDDIESALGGATILGRAERVYANENVVLVTQSDYRFNWDPEAREQTIIHRFDIAGAITSYTASGPVAGSIHNQFSLDEQDGIIRVSTTEQPPWGVGAGMGGGVLLPTGPAVTAPSEPETAAGAAEADAAQRPAPLPQPEPLPEARVAVSRVITLETDGTALVQLGSTDAFGQNEQIYSTRFIGDRGYVVTFRRTDPLFVIDLSDPANPTVTGELVIPGFSDYLYPLGDDHLFAIGRDATPEGVVQGLALQIFDVSNPAAPALAHKFAYADTGASPANIDHRAISFHADRGVVAFPYQNYVNGESTLEIFEISATDGFSRLGGMAMGDEINFEQCLATYYGYSPESLPELTAQFENDPAWRDSMLAQCRYYQQFKRGLFRDNVVYGVSNTGVFAYDLDALDSGVLGQVSLPAEVWDDTNYGYVDGTAPPGIVAPGVGGQGSFTPGGIAGSAGAAGAAGAGSMPTPGGMAGSAGAAGGAGEGGAANFPPDETGE